MLTPVTQDYYRMIPKSAPIVLTLKSELDFRFGSNFEIRHTCSHTAYMHDGRKISVQHSHKFGQYMYHNCTFKYWTQVQYLYLQLPHEYHTMYSTIFVTPLQVLVKWASLHYDRSPGSILSDYCSETFLTNNANLHPKASVTHSRPFNKMKKESDRSNILLILTQIFTISHRE